MISDSVSVKLDKKVGKKVKVLMLAVRLVYNCICCSLDCTNFFTRKMKVVDRDPITKSGKLILFLLIEIYPHLEYEKSPPGVQLFKVNVVVDV